jgi:3-oxoacyl-[acyl-carrier-protein] synthase-1
MALVAGGNAAVAFALQQAMASLASGPIERAIILAADSYLDALSIEWLRDNRRLKTPENPVGLAPGEAAACILLESAAVARRRGARTEGVVRALAVGQEPRAFVKGEMSVGETLAQLLKSCAEQTKQPPPFTTHLIIDLNGEPWRAQELGAALPRVAQVWKPGRLLCPATSLGDTGAASGAVGICYGIRSMVRGAVAGPLLVVSSCVDGHVGVTCLDAARN